MAEVDFDEPVPGSPALRAWAHRFASDIRAGVASHQRSTSVCPPTNVRGNPYSGAASVVLRREGERRGLTDPRWSAVPAGVAPGQVRPGAQPVELPPTGGREKPAKVYHVSDLVRSDLPEPVVPGERKFVEAFEAQRGVAPDNVCAERFAEVASRRIRDLEKIDGVKVHYDAAPMKEAVFCLELVYDDYRAQRPGHLYIPPASAFPDVDHQASSVSSALAHARLALDARERLTSVEGPLDDASEPDQDAADRLLAYQSDEPRTGRNPTPLIYRPHEELIADCAAVDEVTRLGMRYCPSPSVADPVVQEQAAHLVVLPSVVVGFDADLRRVTGPDFVRGGERSERVPARAGDPPPDSTDGPGGRVPPPPPERPVPASFAQNAEGPARAAVDR